MTTMRERALGRRRWLMGLTALWGLGPVGLLRAAPAEAPLKTLTWMDLVPSGWDPSKPFRNRDVSGLSDSDPRMVALMREVRKIWDTAPTRSEWHGRRVRLPGYLVPLEGDGAGQWSEFLVVPYFGACIHSPPPPANQIVHVKTPQPVKGLRSMDTVWITGTLKVERQENDEMGVSGYAMHDAKVERYTEPAAGRR